MYMCKMCHTLIGVCILHDTKVVIVNDQTSYNCATSRYGNTEWVRDEARERWTCFSHFHPWYSNKFSLIGSKSPSCNLESCIHRICCMCGRAAEWTRLDFLCVCVCVCVCLCVTSCVLCISCTEHAYKNCNRVLLCAEWFFYGSCDARSYIYNDTDRSVHTSPFVSPPLEVIM